MYAHRKSLREKFLLPKAQRSSASGPAIFRGPAIFPGRRPSMKTGRSKIKRNLKNSMPTKALHPIRISWPTAVSGNVLRTHGSFSTNYWNSPRYTTTTVPGLNGETSLMRRLNGNNHYYEEFKYFLINHSCILGFVLLFR